MNKLEAQQQFNDTRKMGITIPTPMVKGLPENKHGVINQVVDLNVNDFGDTISTIQGVLTNTDTISFSTTPVSPGPPTISADINFQSTDTVILGADGSGLKADAVYQMSITADTSGLMLDGDEASPGNSQYYGTDSGGTKGFFDITAGTPGGADTNIQFNNMNTFDGSNQLNWDYTNNRLGISTSSPTQSVDLVGNLHTTSIDASTFLSTSNIGTPGANNYGYSVVAISADGHSTLDGTNFNRLTWVDNPDAFSYNIYRTFSDGTPSSLGFLGNVLQGVQQFDDTGIAGDNAPVPDNDTGQVLVNNNIVFDTIETSNLTHYVTLHPQTGTDLSGANIAIYAQDGNGTASGGWIDITGGYDQNQDGYGADLYLAGVPATGNPNTTFFGGVYPVDGKGGDVEIYAGDGIGTDKDGGSLFLLAGVATGSGIQGNILIINSRVPTATGDTGYPGSIAWDSDYWYVCVATDTWKRVQLMTW
jgi:hypothetical protein